MSDALLDNLRLQQLALGRIIDLTPNADKHWAQADFIQWVKVFDAAQRVEMALGDSSPLRFRQPEIDALNEKT